MASPKAPYQPRILTPTLKQRIPGVRVLLIQSESNPNHFHFIGIYPSGYVRCSCEAGKHNRQCHHKLAVIEWIEAQQRVEPMLADMTPQELVAGFNRRRARNNLPLLSVVPLTKKERREAALLDTETRYDLKSGMALAS